MEMLSLLAIPLTAATGMLLLGLAARRRAAGLRAARVKPARRSR